ncbi:MAG: aryl-sulfate sulfotransferase [Candidatus Thorarchaeota archaeon]
MAGRHLRLLLLVLLTLSLNTPLIVNDVPHIEHTSLNQSKLNYLSELTWLEDVRDSVEITVDSREKMNGLNLFGLLAFNATSGSLDHIYALVTDMSGSIENVFYDSSQPPVTLKLINSTTVMFTRVNYGRVGLWNLATNKTQNLPIISGHHDFEYNPFTDTILDIMSVTYGEYDGHPILYDDIQEYDLNGALVWFWNSSEHIPFDSQEFLKREEMSGFLIDWTHANSIFWDTVENTCYLNVRNLDTFYKINKTNGDVIWSCGRLGSLDLYNQDGEQVDSLFYHPHALEMIGPNRFIIYDNDFWNLTRPDPYFGVSRIVEITVNESEGRADILWTWDAPTGYFCPPWGDADRLPNGNRLATFGHTAHPAYITEVNPEGEIVWEMAFNPTDEFVYGIYRVERFFEEPLVNATINGDEIIIETWNTHRTRYPSPAHLRVLDQGSILAETDIEFSPHWQLTNITVPVAGLSRRAGNLTIIVENSDGISGVTIISLTPSDPWPIIGVGITILVGVCIVIAAWNLKRAKSVYE